MHRPGERYIASEILNHIASGPAAVCLRDYQRINGAGGIQRTPRRWPDPSLQRRGVQPPYDRPDTVLRPVHGLLRPVQITPLWPFRQIPANSARKFRICEHQWVCPGTCAALAEATATLSRPITVN
jgi:hypothetical protein